MTQKKILILDYSETRIEASAIQRWLPANAEVSSLFIDTALSFPDDLIDHDFTHVIHSGSELSIMKMAPFTNKAVNCIQNIRQLGIAQMGICYGHQLLCKALVGNHAVRTSPNGFEAGWNKVTFNHRAIELLSVKESEVLWQHHFDEVIELPEGSELLATNQHTKIQAYVNFDQQILGTQFHPEFDRRSGNALYLRDRGLLEKNRYDVEEIVKAGPSIDAGKIFFDFFLEQIAQSHQ